MKSIRKKNIDICDIKGIYYINIFLINYLLDILILFYQIKIFEEEYYK